MNDIELHLEQAGTEATQDQETDLLVEIILDRIGEDFLNKYIPPALKESIKL